jgi:ABC-type sugar transport system ATPase subunit
VRKSYGQVYALGGVNMHVDRAEVVGLVGDNGAGKSTLIKILAGAVRPTTGEILVHGTPVTNWNAARSREAGSRRCSRTARWRCNRPLPAISSWGAKWPGASAS